MKVDIESNESGPRVAQKNVLWIDFNDKAIEKLFIKSGNRVTVKFKNIKVSYLTGLIIRYSPLTQKKRFYSKIKYKRKTQWINLNEFIPGHYGTSEVSEELLGLYKKYYEDGKWKHNPNEQLITQRELEQSQELSVREVIQRLVQAQFPRKGKLGRLAKGSQKTFTKFLMGYHKRYYQLIFEEDEKITYTWDEPVRKDPGADYKPGRFRHLDEAISNTKKG